MGKFLEWTNEQIVEITNLYLIELLSLEDLGRKYNCSPPTIKKLLWRNGISTRSNKEAIELIGLTKEEKTELVELYKEGKTFKFLAKKYKRDVKTVKKVIKDANVRFRLGEFTEQEKQLIFKWYCEEKLALGYIAEQLTCPPSKIKTFLVKENIELRSYDAPRNFSKCRTLLRNIEVEVIDLYVNELMPLHQLAKKYNVTIDSIKFVLGKHDIPIRVKGDAFTKRKVDLDFFSKEKLNDISLYWAGFCFADAYLGFIKNTTKLTFGLLLQLKDKGHIEKFQKCINSNHSLYVGYSGSKTGGVSLQIQKEIFCQHLYDLGKRKANESVLTVPITRDFCRGLVDGDGSIGLVAEVPNITFLGGKALLTDINWFLAREIGTNLNTVQDKCHTVYALTYRGKQAVKVVYFLYQNAPYDARLDRKYQIYLDIFLPQAKKLGFTNL